MRQAGQNPENEGWREWTNLNLLHCASKSSSNQVNLYLTFNFIGNLAKWRNSSPINVLNIQNANGKTLMK